MKVLVSGGAGFIGSMIASACVDEGVTPIIVDNLSSGHERFTRNRIFYHGDVADGTLIDKVFAEHDDIAATIHCASLVVVAESVSHPLHYYRENVGKGIEFVDHLIRNGCRRLIFSSSASIYGATCAGPVDETAEVAPTSPYGRTKVMMEQLLEDCTRAYDLRVIALRYFNPIGADPSGRTGSQVRRPSHVLGRLIDAARTGSPFPVTGTEWPTRDGSGIRDYVHVWDLARAHVNALRRFDSVFSGHPDSRFQVVNLGSGNGTTVFELIAAFQMVTGIRVMVRKSPPRDGDLPGGYATRDRAWQLLGWRPTLSVEDGIRHALRWSAVRDRVLGE